NETRKITEMEIEDLTHLGDGVVGYIREIAGVDAVRLLGGEVNVAPDAKLFCLYQADGTPISISGTHEGAVGSAFEHELMPMSVH
ncbi:MAG: DUF1150 family protein, partial [Alphaproteobacteria bacterium]|nr:DUF1150 family protein [Alphaproteobacteria bacterium]